MTPNLPSPGGLHESPPTRYSAGPEEGVSLDLIAALIGQCGGTVIAIRSGDQHEREKNEGTDQCRQ